MDVSEGEERKKKGAEKRPGDLSIVSGGNYLNLFLL